MYELQYVLDNSKTTGYNFIDGNIEIKKIEQIINSWGMVELKISNLLVSNNYKYIKDTTSECVNAHEILSRLAGNNKLNFDISIHKSKIYRDNNYLFYIELRYDGFKELGTRIGEAVEMFMDIINRLDIVNDVK